MSVPSPAKRGGESQPGLSQPGPSQPGLSQLGLSQLATTGHTHSNYTENLITNFKVYREDKFETGPVEFELSKSYESLKEFREPAGEFVNGSEVGFIDTISIGDSIGNLVEIGIFRWLWPGSHIPISIYPFTRGADPCKAERINEMQKYRDLYKLKYVGGFPLKLETLPRNEKDLIYTIRIGLDVAETDIKELYARLTIWTLEKLDDLNLIYSRSLLPQPKDSLKHWKEDTWFGYQRLNRCNPKLIRLCEEIPSKPGVDEAIMEPVLKGETLEGLIKKKRLFYTDLEILDGVIHRKEYDMCAPIALFMLDSNDDLTPIAIQLQQDKRQGNPVFLPTDDESVWTLAKMWYNMADANYHQCVVHLGLTHMLMQIVIAHMHRNIFPTHPLFKILAPHTYLLMLINDFAFKKLINPGAWVDQTMTIG
ncbi:polyunsaturated fatty acid lipoxygenase ALOX15B-like [Octopus sinensis]|uniref:Polyunsaturated fatty acid lipoxygenase ALOX15B-like n=1 Tax=Octopus sinensis TaxID=2607531 RepID=A0A7E6F1L8_9MOLL|nr:polyunsaturated fatty acid lipoxygenase ALOX15B-like [Octopus sinensis]